MFLKLEVKLFTDVQPYLSKQEFPGTHNIMSDVEAFVPGTDT